MGVTVPSAFVSLGDLDSAMNSLQVMFNYQASTGAFDESGPPLLETGSDTYHMWTMIGTYNYFLYTKDTDFLETNWAGYQLAMSYILSKVDNSGLLNATGSRDWGRLDTGGHLTEANMILYQTLITGAKLATWASNSTLSDQWAADATALQSAINDNQWDSAAGCFMNNDVASTLYPQDANSLSLMWGIQTRDSSQTALSKVHSIEACLEDNWTPIGPVPPELPDNISPFITSFELLRRLAQRDTDSALELLRLT
jgi:Bacterial alpha-L-rhamnosidase 6 hairpin glycosidase domain